jgi:hypothetical protein
MLIGTVSTAAPIALPTTANNLAGNTVTFSPPSTVFSFTALTPTGTNGGTPTLSSINVAPLSPVGAASNAAAVPPFGFALNGSVLSVSQGQTGDLLVQYTVTSTTPILQLILSATGGGFGGGSASITETITNNNGGGGDGSFTLGNGGTVIFNLPTPSTSISISKDINANGGASAGGGASYSSVSNLVVTTVPEPASVVMLGCGLVGAIGLGLRRTKKTA